MSLESVEILGVAIQRWDAPTACGAIFEAVYTMKPMRVSFANANLLNVAYKDTTLRAALNRSVVLNDGVGINMAARRLYNLPFPDNLNGTDFVPRLLDSSATSLRVYLLGGKTDVNEEAIVYFKSQWPQHEVVGAHHGHFSRESQSALLDDVAKTNPQLVLVALGNGLQEKICDLLCEKVPTVGLAVGALFDFWTRRQPRAPLWLREWGGEWIYRLSREPRRLGHRYLIGNPLFLLRVWLQMRRRDSIPSTKGIVLK